MDDHPVMEKQERLQALLGLLRDRFARGKNATLALLIGKDASYVGRLFYPEEKKGAKGIGPEIIDACTASFDLPRGFWDMDPDEAASALGLQITAPTQSAPHEADLTITQYKTGGKMGHGLVLQDQPGVIRSWVVSPEWVQLNVHRITSAKNLAIVTGFGDSMRPLFNPGDPLLVDRGITRADVDGVYFFRVGDEGYVKRLQRIPTADGPILRAKSDNPRYDPFDITRDMDCEIFGRVVKAWCGEDF